MAKMLVPETERQAADLEEVIDGEDEQAPANVIEAAANGAASGVQLAINVGGMKPLAPSMDTVGILSKTVEDAMLLATTLWETAPIDLDGAVGTAPRIAFCSAQSPTTAGGISTSAYMSISRAGGS